MKQETKRRALYFFTCDKCGHKRTSRLYWRAKELICLKCRKDTVPENQLQLFEPGIIIEEKKDGVITKAKLVEVSTLEKDIIKIAFGRKKKYAKTL